MLIIERKQIYRKTLSDLGFHFIIPLLDRVVHVHDLKERDISFHHFAVTVDSFQIFVLVTIQVKVISNLCKKSFYHI